MRRLGLLIFTAESTWRISDLDSKFPLRSSKCCIFVNFLVTHFINVVLCSVIYGSFSLVSRKSPCVEPKMWQLL
jgi:hypothetical protein